MWVAVPRSWSHRIHTDTGSVSSWKHTAYPLWLLPPHNLPVPVQSLLLCLPDRSPALQYSIRCPSDCHSDCWPRCSESFSGSPDCWSLTEHPSMLFHSVFSGSGSLMPWSHIRSSHWSSSVLPLPHNISSWISYVKPPLTYQNIIDISLFQPKILCLPFLIFPDFYSYRNASIGFSFAALLAG